MQTQIRESLISFVNSPFKAAFPDVPIVFDNDPFDRNSPPPLWVEFEIRFADGAQVNISSLPSTRIYGFVYISAWAKEGTGSKRALALLDWFSDFMKYRYITGVNIQAPEPVSPGSPKGWYLEQMKFYFYSNPG